jgi:hypothetical protein
MKIQKKELFHGAALTRLVEHHSFKALNKADGKYGHYLVNTDKRLLVKHSEKASQPWPFTFTADDLSTLESDIASGFKTHVVLVCGQTAICLLKKPQIRAILDLDDGSVQWVRVKLPGPGASMRVSSRKGELKKTVPNSAFPARVFT